MRTQFASSTTTDFLTRQNSPVHPHLGALHRLALGTDPKTLDDASMQRTLSRLYPGQLGMGLGTDRVVHLYGGGNDNGDNNSIFVLQTRQQPKKNTSSDEPHMAPTFVSPHNLYVGLHTRGLGRLLMQVRRVNPDGRTNERAEFPNFQSFTPLHVHLDGVGIIGIKAQGGTFEVFAPEGLAEIPKGALIASGLHYSEDIDEAANRLTAYPTVHPLPFRVQVSQEIVFSNHFPDGTSFTLRRSLIDRPYHSTTTDTEYQLTLGNADTTELLTDLKTYKYDRLSRLSNWQNLAHLSDWQALMGRPDTANRFLVVAYKGGVLIRDTIFGDTHFVQRSSQAESWKTAPLTMGLNTRELVRLR